MRRATLRTAAFHAFAITSTASERDATTFCTPAGSCTLTNGSTSVGMQSLPIVSGRSKTLAVLITPLWLLMQKKETLQIKSHQAMKAPQSAITRLSLTFSSHLFPLLEDFQMSPTWWETHRWLLLSCMAVCHLPWSTSLTQSVRVPTPNQKSLLQMNQTQSSLIVSSLIAKSKQLSTITVLFQNARRTF